MTGASAEEIQASLGFGKGGWGGIGVMSVLWVCYGETRRGQREGRMEKPLAPPRALQFLSTRRNADRRAESPGIEEGEEAEKMSDPQATE